jgi:hypothetical protein
MELTVAIPRAHPHQRAFIDSPAKRKDIRAGRRGGKTVGAAILAVRAFLYGRRVLYATPTQDQIDRFWHEVKLALAEALEAGLYYKNETRHIIERTGTEQRIRAKTAYNADSLRGDYADLLILDEWQLMNEEAWERVGAPMLLDNNGDAVFIYTPPYVRTRSATKATDPLHAAKLYKMAKERQENGDERWAVFHFASHDNPHIDRLALSELTKDMTAIAYQMEIEALDIDDQPGALWTRDNLEETRVTQHPALYRIVVAVDPQATTGQTGILVVHGYVIDDATPPAGVKPSVWGSAAVAAYHRHSADRIVGEINNGGDMIEHVVRSVPNGESVAYGVVRATRGKHTRAEPVSALFEQSRGHMVGYFPDLEDQLCQWVPGDASPDRLDAMVWAFAELGLVTGEVDWDSVSDLGTVEDFESRWE